MKRIAAETISYQLGLDPPARFPQPVTIGALPPNAASLAFGTYHSCALAGGLVQCWGANNWGQLGDGTATAVVGRGSFPHQPAQLARETDERA